MEAMIGHSSLIHVVIYTHTTAHILRNKAISDRHLPTIVIGTYQQECPGTLLKETYLNKKLR